MNDNRTGYNIDDQYATYFVTFTLVGWIDLFTRKECAQIIIDSLNYCTDKKGLIVYAYVIMSSHVHLILSAKESTSGLSDIIRDLRKYTAKELITFTTNSKYESRKDWLKVVYQYHSKYHKGTNHKVWKRGFHPMLLTHPKFTYQKLNYIHNNPVAAKIVSKPEHYINSSALDYLGISGRVKIQIIDFGVEEGYVFTG